MLSRHLALWCSPTYMLVACGLGDVCTDASFEHSLTPVITGLVLHSQLEEDPWLLVFDVSFTDADGDLVGGNAELYINGAKKPGATQPLRDLFRQSAVSDDSTSGHFSLPLRFDETMPDGAQVQLGLQLVDASGYRSRCYSLTIDFSVSPVLSTQAKTCI
jgi:hypothetical protein